MNAQAPNDPPGPSAAQIRMRRVTFLFAGLIFATFSLTGVPTPWSFVGVATSLASIGVGIWLIVLGRKASVAPFLQTMLIVGLLLAITSTFSAAGSIAFQDELRAYQECQQRALSTSAQRACDAQWEADVAARQEELPGEIMSYFGVPLPADDAPATPTPVG